jgi:predicted SprT family Zn-dependent metalloprotease
MDLDDAEALAHELIAHYLPGEWTFAWDRAVRRFGACRSDLRRISLSRHLTALNEETVVRDTLLHEIAHALAPASSGHNAAWRRIAASLGAQPERCIDPGTVRLPNPPLVGRCPACGWEVRAHRRGDVACRRCCVRHNRGRYDRRFALRWERRERSTP